MRKVLISACLLGEKVRYDGGDMFCELPILARWREEERLVPICPEVAGGLGVPRPAAEIEDGSGERVLDGTARVVSKSGEDVTRAFISGAEAALELARRHRVALAVLTERSPSCGSEWAYDGSFTGTLVAARGVTAALLTRAGIPVFSPARLAEADTLLRALEEP